VIPIFLLLGGAMIDEIRIAIVYDNYLTISGLENDWGFAAFIEGEKIKMLFDTGGNGELLLRNMTKMKIDPKRIEKVFLSHFHGDHTGGLKSILRENPNLEAFVPKSFSKDLKQGYRYREIREFCEIMPGFYSTGEMGRAVIEQTLIINTSKGLLIITGCAHPGIVEIVKRARERLKRPIHLVLGGFHLFSSDEQKIRMIATELKKMDVEKVAPCHCSGDNARRIFKEIFGDDYYEIGVGWSVEVR